MTYASAADFAIAARRKLPRHLSSYVDGGAFREVTLAANSDDFDAITLEQRVFVDVAQRDTGTTLLGDRLAMPLVLSPVGLGGMVARRGERQAYRAVSDAGLAMCLSTMSVCSVGEVSQLDDRRLWFQLYMLRDRGALEALMDRARAAGVTKLVVTADLPVPGIRYREIRESRFGASGLMARVRPVQLALSRPAWAIDVGLRGAPHSFGNLEGIAPDNRILGNFWRWAGENFDAGVTWSDVDWLKARWGGPLAIKGILSPADASMAVEHGADAVIVSNHGGRQLDGVKSAISALPAIADEIRGRIPVILDGGVRSGLDILKALCLGASACMIGRPWVHALAADGQAGVARLMSILQQELSTGMALTGATSLAELSRPRLTR